MLTVEANMRCLIIPSLWLAATSFIPAARNRHRSWRRQSGAPALLSRAPTTAALGVLPRDVDGADDDDDGTVLTLVDPGTGRTFTLVGTAHLSKRSNEQVEAIVSSVRPDVVAVELDAGRLHRIGLSDSDLPDGFATADDIVPPPLEDDEAAAANRPWWNPVQDFFLDAFTKFARKVLTGMYEDLGRSMGDGMVGGGEFLAAINAAKADDVRAKIVLADRDSASTIRRAAELALRTGDPLGVLNRLSVANQAEMERLEAKVRDSMAGADEAEVMERLIETIKADGDFRDRLFARLEEEVPVFTRAFIMERDYIMAEAIRREEGARHVVAVVGLAHVPGVAENLRSSFEESSSTLSLDSVRNLTVTTC